MNELIKKVTQFLPSFSFRLDGNKRLALLAAAAIAATAIIVSVLWNGNHGYVSLYGSQENIPVSQIVTVLDGEKLEYRIDPQSGQILVPEETLSKTRMTLAAKGVQAMLPSGYELMDKDEVLGASQFVQNIRYKRSLEGELAQSIMTLDAVESARVHLALNEESSFVVSDEPQNSASVVVRLHYGSKLDLDQVNAIVHLVSGSVPGLKASQVSVVDQAGNLLSDGIGAGEAVSAATRKRDQILKDIQDKTRASLANVLDSLVGTGNYRVSVMPDLDLSNIDETQEHYGDTPKVNREETVLDIGLKVAAALVGTFLGVFICYCLMDPLANAMEQQARAEHSLLECVRTVLVAQAGGKPTLLAVDAGRKLLHLASKPTFANLDAWVNAMLEQE